MASVCLYFQVHQPYRLRRYSVFDTDSNYFDDHINARLLKRIVTKCYLPTTELLLKLVRKHGGRFRLAYSLTGVIAEQLQRYYPQMIELLQQLAATGCVEFLAETYHHSLAFLYSRDEFKAQVDLHARLMQELFGQTPTVFRNTELIYSNELADYLRGWGKYKAILAEGADQILAGRLPDQVYHVPGDRSMKLLLKHYRLSDDIAFRFSNVNWPGYPLTAAKFAHWVWQATHVDRPSLEAMVAVAAGRASGAGGSIDASPGPAGREPVSIDARTSRLCNLFLDYETFGEHQWPETGIFDFLEKLPDRILGEDDIEFKTPSQCADAGDAADEYDVPHMISWADTERDLSAWLGHAMQSNALHELYKLEEPIKRSGDEQLLTDWRRLTASDHFYYMCTKYFADGDVHTYFNPYESPYDSYINFMNVLDHLRSRAEEHGGDRPSDGASP